MKPTNVLLNGYSDNDSVERLLMYTPVAVYGDVELPDGRRYPAWVTQPLQPRVHPGANITGFEADLIDASLVDYGHGALLV